MPFEAGRFEALRERLLAGGIGPRRVRRYLRELEDHLAELTARECAAGYGPAEAAARASALVGSEDELAQSWLSNPRLKSFTARAPWLVFGLLPPFALILGVLVQMVAMGFLLGGMGLLVRHAGNAPAWLSDLFALAALAGNFLVIPTVVLLFVGFAVRRRRPIVWPAVSIAIVLVLSLHWDTQPLALEPGWSAVSFTWRQSGNIIRVGFAPLFLYAWWKTMATHGFSLTLQYALILLPFVSLLRTRRRSAV